MISRFGEGFFILYIEMLALRHIIIGLKAYTLLKLDFIGALSR